MLQPVNLQLAHFNVERAAQTSRDSSAVAQQAVQVKEVVEESVRRTQTVQAGLAAGESRKVKRKSEDEEREHRRGQGQFSQADSREDDQPEALAEEVSAVKKAPKSFVLYA